ncbi:low temperature requirement A protein (LtrA) [Micromonospora kangleipakensis]|uniref:Low temperature requirement A protein (LtrA) n=1 Tax=Micromonospora kangleipakensis TaxID=1077942 RepID=A0A4Q8BFG9_9ACTN|nr:low temperature requirement protein A [Micromonospora kangleipakensis]RZU75909.1 low temperature requirement A protein (LtrA) [Micromonospora kangleipakensis]
MNPAEPEAAHRVTTVEIFFDVVFVFTITQLAGVLEDDPTWAGFGRVVLVLGVL